MNQVRGTSKAPGLVQMDNLVGRMNHANASITKLAESAGAAPSTIERARKGFPVLRSIAEAIDQALTTVKFEKSTPGRRPKATFLPVHRHSESISVKPTYMNRFSFQDDPDQIVPVRAANPQGYVTRLPIHKTEAEVDRLWEYNRMMGRV